ncbi:Phenylacetate-coenzyme A ligase [Planctomycetes bacterium CA13]|uniref:Phenylacetate-coenzyme A ligase n=1 Tax=Novipirellula herctigrandis TaxID=2527986 RepID=A0A5C5Z3L5_9BACT|nr:Phenylacetate-coenzyme A ligase [Planctomycetes bacterium CA13]
MRLSSLYGQAFQSIALPAMLAPTQSKATSLARQMRRQQRWPIARIKEYQLSRLTELMRLAEQESQFYRQRWHQLGLSADRLRCLDDIRQFPITSKEDLESHFPDGIAVQSRRNADWQYVGTRGTTRRVMVIHDFERRDYERAAIMVALTEDSPYRYGTREVSIPPDACSVHCGIESDRAVSVSRQLLALATRRVAWNRESISDLRGLVMDTWICAKTVLPPLPLDGDDSVLRDCVRKLREQRPMQLTALPEYLRALADYVRISDDQPPPIPVIRPMGANFPTSWKTSIESALRGSLREHYGSREMGPMAFDCHQTNGMHLLMSQHLIEIVHDGQPVLEGEVGRVLVTDLHNLAMPIIRYDIGDLARIDTSPCPCGRTTARIFLEGRVDDALVTDSGELLTAEAVSNFFYEQPEIKDFQLTEGRGGKLTLRIVPATKTDFNERAIEERFLSWMGQSRSISVRTTQAIRPEESGKFRHCKAQPWTT